MISRRRMLRGVGASLGLPWLEAMMPSPARAAATGKPPVRMAILYMPNGVHEGLWTPAGEGKNFTLSPSLEPLADLKDDVLILTNLWNEIVKDGSVHLPRCAGFLTCTRITKTQGVDISCNGIPMRLAHTMVDEPK